MERVGGGLVDCTEDNSKRAILSECSLFAFGWLMEKMVMSSLPYGYSIFELGGQGLYAIWKSEKWDGMITLELV